MSYISELKTRIEVDQIKGFSDIYADILLKISRYFHVIQTIVANYLYYSQIKKVFHSCSTIIFSI